MGGSLETKDLHVINLSVALLVGDFITTGVVRKDNGSGKDSVHTGEDLREGNSRFSGSTLVVSGHRNGTGRDGGVTLDGLGREAGTNGPAIGDSHGRRIEIRSGAEDRLVDRSGGVVHVKRGLKILRLASGEYTN